MGKDWRDYVRQDQHLLRPTDILRNRVDPSQAEKCLGWKAKYAMKEVISMMLEAEIKELRE
jgi:GDP-D-mannose dehydratase